MKKFIFGVLILAGILYVGMRLAERRIDPPDRFAKGEKLQAELTDKTEGEARPAESAGSIQGSARLSDGSLAFGAMVTAHSKGFSGLRVSTYAVDGNFVLTGLPYGEYEISARNSLGEALGIAASVPPSGSASVEITFNQPNGDPYPAAYYAANLQFPSEEMRRDFQLQCRYCHQLGSPITRRHRTVEEWNAWITKMEGMGALLRSETREALPSILEAGMTGKPKTDWLLPSATPEIATTVLREWPMGIAGAYIHDLAVSKDGWIYGVDMSNDTVHALQIETGESKNWNIPRRGHPRGGYLQAAINPVGTFNAYQAPHSVEVAEEGRLWVTLSLGNEIMAMNPVNGETQHWSLPRGAFYPHTIRVKGEDVWFTVALSNHLGHLDLRTNELTVMPLPTSNGEQVASRLLMGPALGLASLKPYSDAHLYFGIGRLTGNGSRFMPLPYGIALHPDGSVWYSKVYDDRIGRFDPVTGAIQEWETPFWGPRRLEIDRDGVIWIPSFGNSLLARFDPKEERFSVYPLPLPAEGVDSPYALNIHPQTGDIWITSTQMDVLYRFNPKSESFTVYPLPTRVAFMREIEFTSDGEICTCYSNIPDRHMPDPKAKIFCLKAP
ncbi:MAG: hypothetical protein HY538_05215 [Deltaproteobacteria bacterium]|nr:hypothetical protein [Deltaproteobacteria bacterium]